jgi:membrane-associated protease RseP (regulator of RpoE activity)
MPPESSTIDIPVAAAVDELRLSDAEKRAIEYREMIAERWAIRPLLLFLATCLSLFFVGLVGWNTQIALQLVSGDIGYFLWLLRNFWTDGLIYMLAIVAILGSHEMGHFIAAARYKIYTTLPLFIPMPMPPLGTFGAVIAMEHGVADRKQIFDVGLAGPLAGLVVAAPVLYVGAAQLDFTAPATEGWRFGFPLVVKWLLAIVQPTGYDGTQDSIAASQINPLFMAGLIGLVVTGLNMMPVSQLDGGHVIYALFRKRSWWIARAFICFAAAHQAFTTSKWGMMIFLVILMGVDHPPTSNDARDIGWFRWGLGFVCLAIPILCFSPSAIILPNLN